MSTPDIIEMYGILRSILKYYFKLKKQVEETDFSFVIVIWSEKYHFSLAQRCLDYGGQYGLQPLIGNNLYSVL